MHVIIIEDIHLGIESKDQCLLGNLNVILINMQYVKNVIPQYFIMSIVQSGKLLLYYQKKKKKKLSV